jgi:hypothetical protein
MMRVQTEQTSLLKSWNRLFESGGITPGQYLWMGVQLLLVAGVMYLFRIEQDRGLLLLLPVLLGGFLVHALLPVAWRKAFFVGLSVLGIALVMGGNALWLLGLGGVLLGLSHLPISIRLRVLLVLAVVVLLAALRAGWLELSANGLVDGTGLSVGVIPILGAMFMFRLPIYLYDLRFEKKPASWSERLGYFFMLPNVCFPLFPVVDYQAWRRTWYDKPAAEIYQKGLLWMFRGVTHLILYRLVYHHFTLGADEVQSIGQLVQFMVSTYLLYLRVSGLFHLAVGILCLFGYNLPETHHLYYLPTSFNDYWRRINIYWKDFMMKLFYYPAFMRVKRWGMTTGLVLATIWVFFGTWALHSYQWFWTSGQFLLSVTDTLFWAILGGLVVYNAVQEARKGRKRTLKKEAEVWQGREGLRYALKVTGMIVTITTLWTLWSSPTLFSSNQSIGFLDLMAVGGTPLEVLLLVLGLAGLVLVLFVGRWLYLTGKLGEIGAGVPSARWARTQVLVGCAVLGLLGTNRVTEQLGREAWAFLAPLEGNTLNERDKAAKDENYYEGILKSTNPAINTDWNNRVQAPPGWEPLEQSDLVRKVESVYRYELVPGYRQEFRGVVTTVNQWGMRDQDYPREKPAGTFRIALLGASYEMGSGVNDGEDFSTLVEARLNEAQVSGRYQRYEILNFAVGGYSILQNRQLLEDKVFDFQPDVVVVTGHSGDAGRTLLIYMQMIQNGIPLPPRLEEIRLRLGIERAMTPPELRRILKAGGLGLGDEVLGWGYAEIVRMCRERGVTPVWMFVPRTDGLRRGETVEHISGTAQEAGFLVLSLDGAYGSRAKETVWIGAWDAHPNAFGHQLLADRFYQELLNHAEALNL